MVLKWYFAQEMVKVRERTYYSVVGKKNLLLRIMELKRKSLRLCSSRVESEVFACVSGTRVQKKWCIVLCTQPLPVA
jgi:hypothetical protein